ncbi:MAG: hypothetical protein R2798_08865 [Chitinophagales bacterium]|nr:hypothetical protein [Bacteroidota bacterium]MCB9043935.1 hypothetical protein [Chitinophagales bacterium]
MQINIKPESTLADIKRAFNALFSYLKLEFFSESHFRSEASPISAYITDLTTPLQKINPDIEQGTIFLSPETTVWELEKSFEKEYGLHVQVFRYSTNLWLVTSATDNWSLKKQNDTGKASIKLAISDEEMPDYHEQD